VTLLGVQRRLVELGRIRLGDKGPKGEPRKLTSFRLTSASKHHLDAAAQVYGGTVRKWAGAPDEGYFELLTTSPQLDILIPPTLSAYSQYYELWDAGGCQRRCDGETDLISGGACLCDPDNRECKVTTRVSVMLPKVPGLGVWRLETHGWNAASSLPSTLDLLGASGRGSFIPAVLRLEQRSLKRKVEGRTVTRRFVVPVIDLVGITVTDLLSAAEADTALVAPANGHVTPALPAQTGPSRPRQRVARPELPPPPEVPDQAPAWREPVKVGGWAVEETEEGRGVWATASSTGATARDSNTPDEDPGGPVSPRPRDAESITTPTSSQPIIGGAAIGASTPRDTSGSESTGGSSPSTATSWSSSAAPSDEASPSTTRTPSRPTTDPRTSSSGSAPSRPVSGPSTSPVRTVAAGISTPDAPAVSPMTLAELSAWLRENRIGGDYAGQVAKQLWPDAKSAADLTDEQRGQLARELLGPDAGGS